MQKKNQNMDWMKKCIQKMTGRRGLALLLAVTLVVTSVKFDWWSLGASADPNQPIMENDIGCTDRGWCF